MECHHDFSACYLTPWFALIKIGSMLTLLILWRATIVSPQDYAGQVKNRIDTLIQSAYQTAAGQFPCKVKRRGNPGMLRWEQVDKCLNEAVGRVDWQGLARQLGDLRKEYPFVTAEELSAATEASLSAHALTYDSVFVVKDPETLLPLTNSLLKLLPSDSFQGLAVYDKAGTQVGTFLGTYSYERSGGLASANKYRLALFQCSDRNGNVQPVGEKLLLDSFGIQWREAQAQRGFRLPTHKLFPSAKD